MQVLPEDAKILQWGELNELAACQLWCLHVCLAKA